MWVHRGNMLPLVTMLCPSFSVRQLPVLTFPVHHFTVRKFPVSHFPVRQFPPLQLRPSFSSPAISSVNCQFVIFYPCYFVLHLPVLHFPPPAFMIVRHFPVLQFQVTPLTAYIFGMKHDIHKGASALQTTGCLLHLVKTTWTLVHKRLQIGSEFSPTLRKFCIPLHCQASQTEISKRNSTKLCQTVDGRSR